VRAVLRHQILEGPAVVEEAGKLIVGHVDLEGVPSWTAVTDAQSRRAGSPLREQLHRERADRLEAALEEERSKVRGTLEAQRSKGFLAAALPRPSSSRSRAGTGSARGACARTSGSSTPRTP
jgi:hypothetical protein